MTQQPVSSTSFSLSGHSTDASMASAIQRQQKMTFYNKLLAPVLGGIAAITLLMICTISGYVYESSQTLQLIQTKAENTPSTKLLPAPLGVQEIVTATMPSTVLINNGASVGSGFFLNDNGLVVTAYHIVADTTRIQVLDSNYHVFEGTVVGKDEATDLALVKITADKKTPPVRIGSSRATEIGSQVIAIGNPLDSFFSVTSGVISSKDRELGLKQADDNITTYPALQTDTTMNMGNSGGPLFNTNAELIGINDAISSSEITRNASGTMASIGIGYAIPIDDALVIINQLREQGTATHVDVDLARHIGKRTGNYFGANVDVLPGSSFSAAGLSGNILITAVDHRRVVSLLSLQGYLNFKKPGDTAVITYRQGSEFKTATVTLRSKSER